MMNNLFFRILLICFLSFFTGSMYCQTNPAKADVQPEEGIDGKNVPWIATPQVLVDKMLELARLSPGDLLVDLGSGDGRLVIAAAKRGSRAMGIEYNPDLVKLSNKNAAIAGVAHMVQFIEADIYEFDFSKATVISMFLLPEINMKLRPKLLNLKPGTRIVSNTFTMQEWQYDDMAITTGETDRWDTAYLWIVPAKVEGTWTIPQQGELRLRQEFQFLKGVLVTGNKQYNITEGRLRGSEISFKVNESLYSGIVTGNVIQGICTSGGTTRKWSATR